MILNGKNESKIKRIMRIYFNNSRCLIEMDMVRKLATKRPTAKSCLNELLAVGLYFDTYFQVAFHDYLFFF